MKLAQFVGLAHVVEFAKFVGLAQFVLFDCGLTSR